MNAFVLLNKIKNMFLIDGKFFNFNSTMGKKEKKKEKEARI